MDIKILSAPNNTNAVFMAAFKYNVKTLSEMEMKYPDNLVLGDD